MSTYISFSSMCHFNPPMNIFRVSLAPWLPHIAWYPKPPHHTWYNHPLLLLLFSIPYSTLTYYSKPSMYCIILHHSNYSSCKIAFGLFFYILFPSKLPLHPQTYIFTLLEITQLLFIIIFTSYNMYIFPSYLRSMVYFLFLSFIFNFIVEIYSFEYLEFRYFHQ